MDEQQKPIKPELRGLYRNVKISVKALDYIIIACIAVIVIVLAIEMQDPGFSVTFDSKGGTDVESVSVMYGETVPEPEPPTRQGYAFTGWYADSGCDVPWDIQVRTVESSLTLYAGWEMVNE